MKIEISAGELNCLIEEFAELCSCVTLEGTLDMNDAEENEEDEE